MGFVVDKMTLREIGLQELRFFFLSMSLYHKPHTHIRLNACVIRTSGRSLGEISNKKILLQIAGCNGHESTFSFCVDLKVKLFSSEPYFITN